MRDIRGYDPQSLLTGAEIEKGLGYDNSHRVFSDTSIANAVRITGSISQLTEIAPRVRVIPDPYFFAGGKYRDSARYVGD